MGPTDAGQGDAPEGDRPVLRWQPFSHGKPGEYADLPDHGRFSVEPYVKRGRKHEARHNGLLLSLKIFPDRDAAKAYCEEKAAKNLEAERRM